MACLHCGTEVTPRRLLPWAREWCSAACWLRTIGELRDLSLTVSRWGAALDMPDVVRARDDLAHQLVEAALAPPLPRPRPEPPSEPPPGDGWRDLPLYCAP
jgi:hypothetical protein